MESAESGIRIETVGDGTADSMTLRFVGENENGSVLHELRAAHVAEALQGLVGIAGDFARAGAFGDGPAGSEVLVRPAEEGAFLLEVVRAVEGEVAVGAPTLGAVVWWATRSARAEVANFEYLENGKVKILWQDNTAEEVPKAVWEELSKRKRRRKKQLRQIMAALSDPRVSSLEVQSVPDGGERVDGPVVPDYVLEKSDYMAVKPEIDVEETQQTFGVEGQLSAIDFDNPDKWRVKTVHGTRAATVEDQGFLARIASGLAVRKSDIFWLQIRIDTTKKNGHTRNKWVVVKVESHRRAAHDDD